MHVDKFIIGNRNPPASFEVNSSIRGIGYLSSCEKQFTVCLKSPSTKYFYSFMGLGCRWPASIYCPSLVAHVQRTIKCQPFGVTFSPDHIRMTDFLPWDIGEPDEFFSENRQWFYGHQLILNSRYIYSDSTICRDGIRTRGPRTLAEFLYS